MEPDQCREVDNSAPKDAENGLGTGISPELPEDSADNARQYNYAWSLDHRVKSFETDPLHSKAYLAYLVKYLKSPFQKPARRPYAISALHAKPQRSFVQQYLLQQGKEPQREAFQDVNTYKAVPVPDENEIVFLTGRPSAEWLNAIGCKYDLDQRFFHQHLGPILSNQKHWYALPTLPSRSLEVLRLCIPSIVFIGPEGRNIDILGLELARHDCVKQLQRAFLSIQESSASDAGRSIIRRMDIHNGSSLIIEQEMTIIVVTRADHFTILTWTDAGNEIQLDHLPVPSTDRFRAVSKQLAFCPVFFDNHLSERQHLQMTHSANSVGANKQPLALLSSNYGATIDWAKFDGHAPLFVVQELFAFEAASYSQYINMLEQTLSDATGRDQFPSYEHTKLETILHFDYARRVLTRIETHFEEMLSFFKKPPASWQHGQSVTSSAVKGSTAFVVEADFRYLISRVRKLISVCDAAKATLMSNNSMQEAKRSADEAQLVTGLTKATNRLTFIFLPISFVTSVFGMNFSQLGQGHLSIWLWAVITVPMLIVSVLVVERGQWIKQIILPKRYV